MCWSVTFVSERKINPDQKSALTKRDSGAPASGNQLAPVPALPRPITSLRKTGESTTCAKGGHDMHGRVATPAVRDFKQRLLPCATRQSQRIMF